MNVEHLRNRHKFAIAVDIFMIVLLLINLLLISFDWMYRTVPLEGILMNHAPAFAVFYDRYVHAHFLLIDLGFVGVFLVEFCVRWVISIVKRDTARWFFYPFVHWYDLLGCIPLSAFRVVRLLRVFSIVYRLHRLGVIHINETWLYRLAKKYYQILVEEISDRVVENIIDQMQMEVRAAGPTLDKIINDVLRPRQPRIVDWASQRIGDLVSANFKNNRDDIRAYVSDAIAESFQKNGEIHRIEQIPIAGKAISATLERSVANIVYNVIENGFNDMASNRNRILISNVTEMVFSAFEDKEKDNALNTLIIEIVIEVLEAVKVQVAHTKRWRQAEIETELMALSSDV